MIELIKQLIRIESTSGNEAKLVCFFSEWLRTHLNQSVEVDDRNIIIDIKGSEYKEGASTTLLVCSHIDTVPVAPNWTRDPFAAQIEGDAIYGLGANDALASVVALTFAIKEAKARIKSGRLIAAFVCEEEKGGAGFASIEPKLPRYTYAIFGEPTQLNVGYCMRGSVKLKMRSHGKSCHASRPHEGKNAIFQLASDLEVLRTLPLTDDSPWGRATVEPTIVRGGTAENQIPGEAETFLDVRTTQKKHNQYIIDLLRERGLDVEVLRDNRRPMFCETESPLVRAALASAQGSKLYPFGGSCDMAFSRAPSIVFGPGSSERSHAPDEFIRMPELEAGAAAYASIFHSLLG